MARYTSSAEEVRHIAQISEQVPIGGLVKITLKDGTSHECVMVRSALGNNGGQGGWKYYGEVEILMKSGGRTVIDYLDILHATSAWTEQNSKEYEALGLIKIVDYPSTKH